MKTGNKSLDKWANYFSSLNKTNTKFISLIKANDKYFLTHSPPKTVEETEYPDDGLLEEDFRKIAFNNESENLLDEKSRIVIAIYYNVNLNPWKEKYNEKFYEVMEVSLIEGDYEKYGINFEKVISIVINKGYIEKEDFFGISLLRGMLLSKRYSTQEEEGLLKKTIKFNKIKTLLKV